MIDNIVLPAGPNVSFASTPVSGGYPGPNGRDGTATASFADLFQKLATDSVSRQTSPAVQTALNNGSYNIPGGTTLYAVDIDNVDIYGPVSIPAGSYTPADLASTVQAALNRAVGGNIFAVNYDPTSQKFVFVNVGSQDGWAVSGVNLPQGLDDKFAGIFVPGTAVSEITCTDITSVNVQAGSDNSKESTYKCAYYEASLSIDTYDDSEPSFSTLPDNIRDALDAVEAGNSFTANYCPIALQSTIKNDSTGATGVTNLGAAVFGDTLDRSIALCWGCPPQVLPFESLFNFLL